jgi:hypothetical protein
MSAAEKRDRPEDVPKPVDLALHRVLSKGLANAASPEAIAKYERDIADCRDREAREARVKRRRQLEELGVPVRPEVLLAVIDGSLERTEAVRLSEAWLRGPRPMLVFLGDVGVGKTVAAAHVAASRMGLGGAVYVREPMLVRWAHYARHAEDWRRLCAAPTVIVDELGTATGRESEAARRAVEDVVDERLRVARARTLFIGNLSEDAFAKRYGVRTVDRLHEVGSIQTLHGESLRRRPA